MTKALAIIEHAKPWKERRAAMGLNANTKAGRRRVLAELGLPLARGV